MHAAISSQWIGVTPLTDSASWLRAAQRYVAELRDLPPNWDSYNSPSPQSVSIERTSEALATLSKLSLPKPEIFPVPGGGIQIELQYNSRELEIEILPDGSMEYLLIAENGEMKEGAILGVSLCLATVNLLNSFNSIPF